MMRQGRIIVHRLRSLLRRSRVEADMQRELDLHLDQLTKDHLAAGMDEPEARLMAQRQFGPLDVTKEQCRDTRRVNWLDDFAKDLVYAVRLLRKSPGFTLTAVLSLALGIGANTAIFGVVNAFLLRPLPFAQPERLVALFERNVIADEQRMSVAPGNFLDWQRVSGSFERMSAYRTRTVNLSSNRAGFEPQRVAVCECSGNLFSTLGVAPVLGRPFRAEEDRYGAPRVAVISHSLWQQRFAGSRDVVGKAIRVGADEYEVIGVMPRGFVYPYRSVDVWIPLLTALSPNLQIRHDVHFLEVVGRLRSGISVGQARTELDGISARYKRAHPEEATGEGANVVPLHEHLVRNVRTPLLVLLAAVACVLLIACVNIANLMLTRATTRAREIGVRATLGASRGRLIRQLLAEAILLAFAGGAVGAMLAISITSVLVSHAPGAETILPSGNLPVEPLVFLFACGIAFSTGIAVGLFPAFRASGSDLISALKETGRSTMTRAHARFRNALVTAEVALSLVLLVAAGLLVHSFSRLYQVDPGVRVNHTLTMAVNLPGGSYPEPARRSAFLSELSERVKRVPAVSSAGLASCAPLTGSCNILFFYIEGHPFTAGKFHAALERTCDPAYFATAGIPLLRGRTFTKQDGIGFDTSHPRLGSVVISESMAQTFFPNEDPIGKRIFFDFEMQRARIEGTPVPRYEVVGIVGDVPPTLDHDVTPTLYRPLLDVAPSGATLLLHAAVEPRSVVAAVRHEIRKLDPDLAISQVETMRELLNRSTADRRFSMLLFVAFAGLAVVLAAVGLYGVVSYTVAQRRSEIGIRMALGASRIAVGELILWQGLRPAMTGIILGLIAAVFAS